MNEIGQQFFPLLRGQLDGQSRNELAGQAAVLRLLIFLYGVPENAAILPLLGGAFRQEYLLPDKSALSGVIVLYAVIVVINGRTAQIGRRSAGGTARSTAHDLRFQVIDRHNRSLPFCPTARGGFVSFGETKENGRCRRGIVHNCDKAAGGRFSQAGGRLSRQRTTICSEDANEAKAVCQPHRQ